jgi:hypothetical protein
MFLTHVVDLHQVVTVVMVVDALHTDCQGTSFAEVLNWLILMQITGDKIGDLDCSWIGNKTKNFMICLEVLSTVIISDFDFTKWAHFDWLTLIC